MSLLVFLVFGLVVGLLARALMPGDQKMGFVMTTILGVVGSFVGGCLVSLVTPAPTTGFHAAGMIGSVLGAILLLVVVGAVSRRR
jgi:uncharacterized membrane protein YeaQ/YmgE (transglycosylase-associated protein family)